MAEYDDVIAATLDDGYEYESSWSSNELAAGDAGGGAIEVIGGVRFLGVTIPDGATITNAYLRLYKVNGSGSGTVQLRVRAVDDDSAAQFSSGNLPHNATLTTAYVDWAIAMSPLNEWAQSGDLSSIIQELVDTYSGLSSAAVNFALRNNGSSSQYLYFYDREAGTANLAELFIEWTEGGGPPYSLTCDAGSYTVTGQDVALDWSGAPTDTCDMYLDWRAGSDGNAMTTALAVGGCWPATPPASPFVYPSSPASVLAIETDSASPDLDGTLICGGVEHDLADVVQGMRISHSGTASEEVRIELPSSTVPIVSVGLAFKTTLNAGLYEQYAHGGIQGIADADWAVLSTYIDASANVHACLETNGALWPSTPTDGPTMTSDTWYWITIQYNRTTAKAYLRAYLLSTMAQVGNEVEANLVASPPYVWCVDHGLVASEGNTDAGAYSYYGPFMVDWTDGTFPLLPTPTIVNYSLACDGGAFTLAGTDAAALKGSQVDAEAGAYSVAGQDAALLRAARVAIDAGEYALAGALADLLIARRISAEAGSLAVTGQEASLVYVPGGGAYLLTADGGAYAIAGEAAAILRAAKIDIDAGAYAIAGQDVTLVYVPGGGAYILTADGGSYAIAGMDAGALKGSKVSAEAGSYAITGTDVWAIQECWPASILPRARKRIIRTFRRRT